MNAYQLFENVISFFAVALVASHLTATQLYSTANSLPQYYKLYPSILQFTHVQKLRSGHSNQAFAWTNGLIHLRQHGAVFSFTQIFVQSANFCVKEWNLPPCWSLP
jgi:hypothetical protein